MKRIILILIICLNITLISCNNKNELIISNDVNTQTISNEYIYVDIKGEVLLPGVYVVKSNYLIKDVIDLAGGLSSKADISKINLAQNVMNNQMIIIPSKINNEENKTNNSNLVNINTATLSELMTLSGIGKTKAQNIIAYRESKSLFKTIEDIKQVSGIGNEIYNQIKDYITV